MLVFPTLALATLVALAAPVRPHDPGAVVQGPFAERIDRYLTAAAELGLAGTVLVEKDGAVILHKGYGVVDRERGRRADTRTHYLIGSLSKQFTAAAIYQLESRGKLSLADPLSRWFPDAPADKHDITLDQLVHHTGGFSYLPRGSLFDSISVDSMVREIFATPLDFAPGARYQYSSPGYNLLAAVVERASGRSFDAYVRAELLEPAGMTETGFDDEPSRWPAKDRTPSYGTRERDPPLYPWTLDPKAMGAGSVITTCADLWKWELALRNGTVLDSVATRRLFAPGPEAGSPTAHYAGGWNVVKSQRGTTVILHAGDIGGFNAEMRRFVDEHATLIFLSNAREGGRGYREAVAYPVTRILFGPSIELPPVRLASSPKALARWRGSWAIAPAVSVDGRVRGDTVWVLAKTQAAMSALAGSDSRRPRCEQALSMQAATVADTLLRGVRGTLLTTIHPSLPEESHGSLFDLWANEKALRRRDAVARGARHGTHRTQRRAQLREAQGRKRHARREPRLGGWVPHRHRARAGAWPRVVVLRRTPDTLARLDMWNGRVIRVAKHERRAG
jgi:CubicO group peptidase (beta-lactamase class C family)